LLLVRNVVIESEDLCTQLKEFSKDVKVGGSAGWGPFKVSGSYAKSDKGRTFTSENDGKSLKIPGVCVMGFVVRMIGKAPNPMADLKPEDFS
jgi:hypothetical protein